MTEADFPTCDEKEGGGATVKPVQQKMGMAAPDIELDISKSKTITPGPNGVAPIEPWYWWFLCCFGEATVSVHPGVEEPPQKVPRRVTRKVTWTPDESEKAVPIVKVDNATADQFYTARSMFTMAATNGMSLIRMQALDKNAPAPVPPLSITKTIPLVVSIPEKMGVAGRWMKDTTKSDPPPGACDKILKASFFVQSVRNRIKEFEIIDESKTIAWSVKIPVIGMAPRVEKFNKDGSLVEMEARRDDKTGRGVGQAVALMDGRLLIRAWNLGASPEVLWVEMLKFETPTSLHTDHYIYTMDGKQEGHARTIWYKIQ